MLVLRMAVRELWRVEVRIGLLAIAVHEGRALDPASPDGVVIDASFSETRHVRIGETIFVNPTRFRVAASERAPSS